MSLVTRKHRYGLTLLMFGSVGATLTLAGCDTAPPKDKPAATAKSDDKEAGGAKAVDAGSTDNGSDNAKATMDEGNEAANKNESNANDGPKLDGDGTAAADAEHGDPFKVPDGTPAELMQYIKGLQSIDPQANTREELAAFQKKMGQAMVTAADKILAQKPDVAEAIDAVKIKLSVLEFLADAGDEAAAKESEQFQKELASDERPAIVQAVKQRALLKSLSKWSELGADERTALLEEIKQYLATSTVDSELLQLGMAIGNFLESNDAPEAAAGMYLALGERTAGNDDPDVAKYAGRLQGMARRLQLLGNEMDITGTLLDGSEIDWASYRGKVVLVDFWATWCGPCIQELPNVVKNYEKYHDQGFDVIGISLDDNKEKVEEFVAKRKIPWPILFSADEAHQGWEHPMAERYGISGIPAAILIDKEGKVVALEARGPELGKQLAKLLGSGAGKAPAEESKSDADNAETKSEASGDDAKSSSETSNPAADGAEK